MTYAVARAPSFLAARHLGFSIPTVPYITEVRDPLLFPARYGTDTVSCGFAVYDVLLVKDSRASTVYRSGASDFMFDYTLVPGFLDMNRGFAWLDMRVGSQTVRVVTTHVEAFFYDNLQPYSIRQVQQLIHDLGTTTSALIVMGDFNNDPHDPIATGELNTGDRLVASDACPQQAVRLTLTTANASCNTYWMMRKAGYRDVGPDSLVGQNDTWGYRADLAGPALNRLFESALQSNVLGLTARLDYVFVRNGATTIDAHIVGNDWPTHGWRCVDDAQRQHSAAKASRLDLPISEESACAA
jgi:endonuclease/exonuclease/phosphatase family metal-dependent hydrolase